MITARALAAIELPHRCSQITVAADSGAVVVAVRRARDGRRAVRAELRDGKTLALLDAIEVEDPFGGSACMVFPHADPTRLCLWLAELAVEGHRSRPVKELYPALKDDTGWATDLGVFEPCRARTFVSIHERLPRSIAAVAGRPRTLARRPLGTNRS